MVFGPNSRGGGPGTICRGFRRFQTLIKGAASAKGTSNFVASRSLPSYIKIPKMGWRVNLLSYGLPEDTSPSIILPTMIEAVKTYKQNFLQVYRPQLDPTYSRQAVEQIIENGLAKREELVLWGFLNGGEKLNIAGLERELKNAVRSLAIERLDAAIVKIDLRRNPPGADLLQILHELFETLEAQVNMRLVQCYGFELHIPFYQEPKVPGASSGDDDMAAINHHEAMLPEVVEEAALVDNSHFCLMFYPVQLTNKYLVTLPLMEPDAEDLASFPREARESLTRKKPLLRAAVSPMLGQTQCGHHIKLISGSLKPSVVQDLCKGLDYLSPSLKSSKNLEHKVLRAILSAKFDMAVINGEDQLGMRNFLKNTGMERRDRLPFDKCEKVFQSFVLPSF